MKPIFLFRFFTLLTISAILCGCAVISMPLPSHLLDQGPAKTPVELQAIQTREFETDKARLISVFITSFQDQGYVIDKADLGTGLITARTPLETKSLTIRELIPNPPLKFDFQLTTPSGHRIESERSINVLISELTATRSKARVTIVIRSKLVGPGTNYTPNESTDTKPDQYQVIFSRIQQGLFLKKNTE